MGTRNKTGINNEGSTRIPRKRRIAQIGSVSAWVSGEKNKKRKELPVGTQRGARIPRDPQNPRHPRRTLVIVAELSAR
jgi:hypothetical protein